MNFHTASNFSAPAIDLALSLVCAGSADLHRAATNLNDAGVDMGEFADFCREYMGEASAATPDHVALSHEFILSEVARLDSNSDLDALRESLWSNYTDSRFDIDSEAAAACLATIEPDGRNQAWEWLVDETGCRDEVEAIDAQTGDDTDDDTKE